MKFGTILAKSKQGAKAKTNICIGFLNHSALKKEPEFYEAVGMYFDEASKLAGVSEASIAHIKAPDTSLTFTFPIEVHEKHTCVM